MDDEDGDATCLEALRALGFTGTFDDNVRLRLFAQSPLVNGTWLICALKGCWRSTRSTSAIRSRRSGRCPPPKGTRLRAWRQRQRSQRYLLTNLATSLEPRTATC